MRTKLTLFLAIQCWIFSALMVLTTAGLAGYGLPYLVPVLFGIAAFGLGWGFWRHYVEHKTLEEIEELIEEADNDYEEFYMRSSEAQYEQHPALMEKR